MNTTPLTLLLLLSSGLFLPEATAQSPAVRRSPSYYAKMTQNSPFTIPVPKEDVQTVVNTPLNDWVLSGFAEIGEKKVVILQNKRNTGERVMVISGEKNDQNIEVVKIERGASYLQDRVCVRLAGSIEGWVSYDPQYLTIKAPTAPTPPQNKEQEQGGRRDRGERRSGDRN